MDWYQDLVLDMQTSTLNTSPAASLVAGQPFSVSSTKNIGANSESDESEV